MRNTHFIPQPADVTVKVDGTTTATLKWARDFSSRRSSQFNRSQAFVDSEVLRLNDRYVPVRNHILRRSGFLGTVIGSGLVSYISPHSRYQYYGKLMVGPAPKRLTNIPLTYHSGDPNRGALWFERMKVRHLKSIQDGAAKIAGGGR